jgi:hypothetical protein
VSPLAPGSATDQVQHADQMAVDDSVLYLRAEAVLRAQVDDDSIDSALAPHRVTWTDGGHKRAQEVEIEIHGSVLPYPLEHVASVFVSLFMDRADDPYASIRDARTLRFAVTSTKKRSTTRSARSRSRRATCRRRCATTSRSSPSASTTGA